MKKYIISIMLVLVSFITFAQSRIIMDGTDPETGLRAIGTSSKVVRSGLSDTHGLDLSLMAFQYNGQWEIKLVLQVCERVSHAIPKNAILLVRTKSGEVFEFANTLERMQSQDFKGTFSPNTKLVTYHNRASYPVTIDQLKALAAGVVKIRMQLFTETFDTIYKKDPFGEAVAELLTVLGPAMAQNKDIRSDF